ncbi:ubiquitin thioesterase ZRANB1 [Pelomyxa schiedti]|nr:ubiquitin thioesterase ZRANB1 [Pelomyxa schiedti]
MVETAKLKFTTLNVFDEQREAQLNVIASASESMNDVEGFPRLWSTANFTLNLPSPDFIPQFVNYYEDIQESLPWPLKYDSWEGLSFLPTRFFLVPTSGDGNCLCNAMSLSLWRANDSNKMLRNTLGNALAKNNEAVHERFMHNTKLPWGIAEEEWQLDLNSILVDPGFYLSDTHIFMLANFLHRPIVVFGGKGSTPVISGIYLPLLCPPESCFPVPIPMVYFHAHFITVGFLQYAIRSFYALPLCSANKQPLKLHFLTAEEERKLQEIGQKAFLGRWMCLIEEGTVSFAVMSPPSLPLPALQQANTRYQQLQEEIRRNL